MAKGNFIEYVVSNNPNKYPNGGEQGGYWYEKVVLLENGIFFNAINDNGQPTDITIKSTKGFNGILGTPNYISVLENVLINMPEIADSCFSSTFKAFKGKIKIKNATNIGKYAFAYIGGANSTTYAKNIKLYIPATCTTIYGNSNDQAACPFYNRVGPINIYCEASSKPSGWGDYWNIAGGGYGFHTTMWGVTESSFDAL